MQAQAATAFPATPEATLGLVGRSVDERLAAALARFRVAIQGVLDAPLDEARVLEWTTARVLGSTMAAWPSP